MDPAVAARGESKMLDGVRHVHVAAVDAGLVERLLQQPARWADEGNALPVLDVPGLLADERDLRVHVTG
jgi:hypothetical protein